MPLATMRNTKSPVDDFRTSKEKLVSSPGKFPFRQKKVHAIRAFVVTIRAEQRL
jgi:hypothetical protein